MHSGRWSKPSRRDLAAFQVLTLDGSGQRTETLGAGIVTAF